MNSHSAKLLRKSIYLPEPSVRNLGLALAPFRGLKFLKNFLILVIFGNCHFKFDENLHFFSYTKSFLDFGREPSQLLNFSSLNGLVSYNPVSYKKHVNCNHHKLESLNCLVVQAK